MDGQIQFINHYKDIQMKLQSIGFPRMLVEKGEKRDFLPDLFGFFRKFSDVEIFVEEGYGAMMGFSHNDYLKQNPNIKFSSHYEIYRKNMVVVLKAPPEKDIKNMNSGSALFSMFHYDTRPIRNKLLLEQGIAAFSMDSIVDDYNKRLFVNYYGTSRSGTKVAFYELKKKMKDFSSNSRGPIKVTIMGMGGVGLNSAKAFEEFSDTEFLDTDISGVIVRMLPRSITKNLETLKVIFKDTDILVDASKRVDTTKSIIPNNLIAYLPEHAVILDLAADPYNDKLPLMQVKGIEGIPTGNLEKYVIEPDDELYESIPYGIDSTYRKTVVSCNGWPGVDPIDCMAIYGRQLIDFLRVILSKDTASLDIESENLYERALVRSTLDYFTGI